MIRLVLAAGLLASAVTPSAAMAAPSLSMVVALSAKTLDGPLAAVARLRPNFPDAEVVASADCSNMAPGRFLAILAKPAEQAVAQDVRQKAMRLGTIVSIEPCRTRPKGRIALGVPLIDRSVEKLSADAVNWTDADRISDLKSLPDGVLWLRRTKVDDPDDPREGRRTAVLFFPPASKAAVPLASDCTDASAVSVTGKVALSCARGTAADVTLHETIVIDLGSGRQIAKIPQCRAPAFGALGLTCKSETVGKDGGLRLQSKPVSLP